MTLSLEKFTKKQKILGAGFIILCLIVIGLFAAPLLINNKVNAPIVSVPVSSSTPTIAEELNDISSNDGILVDYNKYSSPSFPALKLTDVFGLSKVANPTLQYNGQPRVYIDCGRLVSSDPSFAKTMKKACVVRLVSDGSIAILGDVDTDYIYYRGKTRDERTETLVYDISTAGNRTYLIYEYDYNTQSANYIDRISLVVPETLQEKDLNTFISCVNKPVVPYSDNSCYAVYGKEWYDSNSWYLQHKDNYFRAVNLP
ncbi:MAG: hypothetical protein ACMG57_00820 [Candidatus Dojkabacteria bacterium]